MNNRFVAKTFTAADLRIALSEVYPETSYGSVPVIDQCDALEVYLAYDDGALAEVPRALEAYISHQQHLAA